MSEYTPSRQELIAAWIQSHQEEGWLGGPVDIGGKPKERIAEAHRGLAAVERAAAGKAWWRLADAAYPLYAAAEAVLLAGADKQVLMSPLAKLGAQTNPYRRHEGESE